MSGVDETYPSGPDEVDAVDVQITEGSAGAASGSSTTMGQRCRVNSLVEAIEGLDYEESEAKRPSPVHIGGFSTDVIGAFTNVITDRVFAISLGDDTCTREEEDDIEDALEAVSEDKRMGLSSLPALAARAIAHGLKGVGINTELPNLGGEQIPGAEDSDEDDCEEEMDRLTITLVVTYYVSKFFVGGKSSHIWLAIWWALLATVTAVAEMTVLYALMIANNWWICKEQDDCSIGLACVHWADGSDWSKSPYCMDCYYLIDPGTGYGYGDEPWAHRMVVESGVSGIINASAHCQEQIEAPQHLSFFVDGGFFPERLNLSTADALTYESCVYARAAGANQSLLDKMILQVAFMLLAVQVANDAAEHGAARSVRNVCLPWRIVRGNRLGTVCLIISKLFLNFIGMCFEKVVPALTASSMIMLLISHGAGTTEIILNGLSVIFVLELDNLLAPAFLSCHEQTKIRRYAASALTRHQKQSLSALTSAVMRQTTFRRRGRPTIRSMISGGKISTSSTRERKMGTRIGITVSASSAEEGKSAGQVSFQEEGKSPAPKNSETAEQKRKSWRRLSVEVAKMYVSQMRSSQGRVTSEAYTLCLCIFVALNIGFFRVTAPASGIPCEMMVYYVYYRIALLLGVWLPFTINESLHVSSTIIFKFLIPLSGSRQKRSVKSQVRVALRLVCKSAMRFSWTILCAVFMNTMFWLGCQLFFATPLDVAYDLYLWGFIEDIFGECAASGYKEAYGFNCLK